MLILSETQTKESFIILYFSLMTEEQECPICLEEYTQEKPMYIIKTCNHDFHQSCLKDLICAMCRKSYKLSDFQFA